MAAAREAAPAKINLALHVTGRRADGYHTIETLAVFTAFGDTVAVAAGDGAALEVEGPFAGALAGTPSADNLALRALAAFTAASGRATTARLQLTKRIPVAAGLGGGSADAAATLRLMERTGAAGVGAARLAAIAGALGADVPMCLMSKPLVARGTGETIAPVAAMPALAVVLVHPGVPVSTRDVFAARQGPFGGPLPALPARFGDAADVAAWLKSTRNDLSGPAARVAPQAAEAADLLATLDTCRFARMSGSGAAAFGIFATAADAELAAARIGKARPGWWTTATVTGAG